MENRSAASGPDPGSFGGHPYTPDEIALGYGTDHDPRFTPNLPAAYRQRREKAVREALTLLDFLCRDSLEMPLASAQTHPDHGEISAAFARLAWLVEELRV